MRIWKLVQENKDHPAPSVMLFKSYDEMQEKFVRLMILDGRDPFEGQHEGPTLAELIRKHTAGAPIDELFGMAQEMYEAINEMGDSYPFYHLDDPSGTHVPGTDDEEDDEQGEREQEIRELALDQWIDSSEEINIDLDDAKVSEGDENGAWVSAWLWVSFKGTDFDKASDEESE